VNVAKQAEAEQLKPDEVEFVEDFEA